MKAWGCTCGSEMPHTNDHASDCQLQDDLEFRMGRARWNMVTGLFEDADPLVEAIVEDLESVERQRELYALRAELEDEIFADLIEARFPGMTVDEASKKMTTAEWIEVWDVIDAEVQELMAEEYPIYEGDGPKDEQSLVEEAEGEVIEMGKKKEPVKELAAPKASKYDDDDDYWSGGMFGGYASYQVGGSTKTWTSDRHLMTPIVFPDGTTLYATSMSESSKRDPDNADHWPDFGVYFAQGWKPVTLAYYIPWIDHGLPEVAMLHVMEAVDNAVNWAKEGYKIETGCIGAHGRTGTFLAACAQRCGVAPEEAVAWVRENFCKHAIESERQEHFVEHWVQEYRAGVELSPMPIEHSYWQHKTMYDKGDPVCTLCKWGETDHKKWVEEKNKPPYTPKPWTPAKPSGVGAAGVATKTIHQPRDHEAMYDKGEPECKCSWGHQDWLAWDQKRREAAANAKSVTVTEEQLLTPGTVISF